MELRDQIRQFVVDSFMIGRNPGDLNDGQSLLDMGIIDSTGVLELVGFLEETCRIKIEDEELIPDNLDSIDKLVRFVSRKQA